MSRGARLCKRCGGTKRGRAARVAEPIAICCACGDDVCKKHSLWDSEREGYVCSKCRRKAASAKGLTC